MSIELNCPECKAKLRVADKDLGKRIRCPKCNHVMEARPAGDDTAPEVASELQLLDGSVEVPLGATRVLDDVGAVASSAPRIVSAESLESDAPTTLRGYEIVKELGRGGMGRVFLARQKSLDRLVALKVMNPQRAKDPSFLARFTREAYAAAQMVHHHIVQIYDIGAEHGCHFFTMEYVKGETLSALVQREGKLDPEVAAGYVLQAARGLKFGHDLGMVHRDVKPDNILLNDQGIVKVADLGLVKLPYVDEVPVPKSAGEPDAAQRSTMVTRVGVGVGTPAFMAPEQARDATHVDARADIYSLGCTLYYLVTGKPPFEGKTVAEVLIKHQSASYIPPDEMVKRVPKALSVILTRMLAKRPEQRYPDLNAVIAALEKFLGIHQAGAFTPQEEHAVLLEQCVKSFNEVPAARWRGWLAAGFFGACAAVMLVGLLLGWFGLVGAALGLAVLTPVSLFLVHGWRERTFLFLKFREWVLGASLVEVSYGLGGVAMMVLLLYLFNLLWMWLLMALLALGAALAYEMFVERRLAVERRPALERMEKLIRKLRLNGLDEKSLWHFICKYSGRDWEEFFETLFGYEGKLKARGWLRGEAAQRRNRFAAWRDPLVLWMDAHQRARKEARERKHLEAIEILALQAQGVNAAEAHEKAAHVAEVMVAQAAQVAEVMEARAGAAPIPAPAAQLAAAPGEPVAAPGSFQKLLETAHHPETSTTFTLPPRRFRFPLGSVVAGLVGSQFRLAAGAILLILCIAWMRQNHFLDGGGLVQAFKSMFGEGATTSWDQLGSRLSLPLVPDVLLAPFNSFQPAIAGLVLMISAFLGGWRVSLLAWPAALVILFGGALIPSVGPVSGTVIGLSVGIALSAVGLALRRRLQRAASTPPLLET